MIKGFTRRDGCSLDMAIVPIDMCQVSLDMTTSAWTCYK
jgi:hypothetical protein